MERFDGYTHRIVGRYAPLVARKTLQQDDEWKDNASIAGILLEFVYHCIDENVQDCCEKCVGNVQGYVFPLGTFSWLSLEYVLWVVFVLVRWKGFESDNLIY